MNETQFPSQTIKQGHCITNQMKADILSLYHQALNQKAYKSPSDYIRLHLEQLYGRCWAIMISSIFSELDHHFVMEEHYLLKLKIRDHYILGIFEDQFKFSLFDSRNICQMKSQFW